MESESESKLYFNFAINQLNEVCRGGVGMGVGVTTF